MSAVKKIKWIFYRMSYSFSSPGSIFSPQGICTSYSLSQASFLICLPSLTIILPSAQVSVKNVNFSTLNVPFIYLSRSTLPTCRLFSVHYIHKQLFNVCLATRAGSSRLWSTDLFSVTSI